jgi:hypothetical protein
VSEHDREWINFSRKIRASTVGAYATETHHGLGGATEHVPYRYTFGLWTYFTHFYIFTFFSM